MAVLVLQSLAQQMVLSSLQFPNIYRISVTFETSNEVMPTIWSLPQPMNMPFIFVTCEVLNELRSSEVNDSHIENMPLMSVTPEVLRFSSPSMLVIFDKLWISKDSELNPP